MPSTPLDHLLRQLLGARQKLRRARELAETERHLSPEEMDRFHVEALFLVQTLERLIQGVRLEASRTRAPIHEARAEALVLQAELSGLSPEEALDLLEITEYLSGTPQGVSPDLVSRLLSDEVQQSLYLALRGFVRPPEAP